MTRVHTCNFKSLDHAINYYFAQGFDFGRGDVDAKAAVAEKIRDGEIEIGAKSLSSAGKLFNWDADGRAYYYQGE